MTVLDSFNIKFCLLLAFFSLCKLSVAQVSEKETLFTIDNDKISVKEFLKVYNKNLDLVKDESQKDVDNYLNLYINYKLKVKEARRLGYDKEIGYQREFTSYKSQLSNNYLLNNEVTDELLREAYNRLQQEIKAVHILIRLDQNENDTLAAYNKLVELRDDLRNTSFSELQQSYHNGETMYVEDLGYFTAFKMVYPFENAAYNLEVGEVSMPFRTQFGYHIVKVLDKRKSRGEVTVSHIMITDNSSNQTTSTEQRIREIHKKLKQGESFEILAKQYSDDKGTSEKGGLLSPFEGGQLSSSKFEDVSFGLVNKGDISDPFKTNFGWHIVRLENKRPLKPFDELKAELEVKIGRDSRSSLIDEALTTNIQSLYRVTIDSAELNTVTDMITDDYFKGTWRIPSSYQGDQVLVNIDTLKLDKATFMRFLFQNQARHKGASIASTDLVQNEFKRFVNTNLLNYHKNNLENIDEEYAFVLNEYKEGLLLFNLMEKEIWNKAAKDTVGLRKYFDNHRDKYVNPERYKAQIMTSVNKADLTRAYEMRLKGVDISAITKELNSNGVQRVFLTTGEFTKDHPLWPSKEDYTEGLSQIYAIEDGYAFAIIDDILPSGHMSFNQSKGRAISDYQAVLEEQWIGELKKRYQVTVNDDVLHSVKQQLKNDND